MEPGTEIIMASQDKLIRRFLKQHKLKHLGTTRSWLCIRQTFSPFPHTVPYDSFPILLDRWFWDLDEAVTGSHTAPVHHHL